MRRFVVLTIVLAMAISTAFAQTPTAEVRDRETFREVFGPPLDERLGLFSAGTYYIVRPAFDEGGHLRAVSVGHRATFSDSHPEWTGSDFKQLLSDSEYQSLLLQINQVKPLGAHLGSAEAFTYVTNSTGWLWEVYENAFIDVGYRPASAEESPVTSVRMFSVHYVERVQVLIDKKARCGTGKCYNIDAGGKRYMVTASEGKHLKVGRKATFLAAGPLN